MRCSIEIAQPRTWRKRIPVALLLLFAGCFGGERSVRHAEGYHISPPKRWESTDKGNGDRAFKLKSGSLVAVSSSCNRHADADLQVLTRHLLIGVRNVVFIRQTYLEVNGAQGLYSSVRGEAGQDPIRFEIFVISKGGCIFDFTLLNKKQISAGDVAEFKQLVMSFRYAKREGN
ncbi:MAG: hypothetical protein R3B54_13870 [Bdellovibrionota bacterium]